jgi:hypothetical protein
MLKHLMSGASLLALALREGENDTGADEKAKLREQLAKGNTTKSETIVPPVEEVEEGNEDDDEDEEKEEDKEEPKLDADGNPIEEIEETAEEKEAREKKEKEDFKAKRKDERMQKRIDTATAKAEAALAEVAKWKAIAEAKPDDQKLTKEEVDAKAEAIANEKITAAELNRLQIEFNKNCDKIQASAEKLDKEFNKKVHELAADLGPLPTPMMNELFDLDNGAEILVYLASDVDEAERIFDLQSKPAKLGRELGKLSDKLAEAKKPKPKPISQVPDPMAPVNGNRVQTTQITQKDTTPEGMENYVRKRQLQIEQRRKQGR